MMYNWKVESVEDLDDYAKKFIALFPEPKIFALSGEMGNGKTTFIAAILNQMGITDFDGSPTFSLVNEYEINESKKYTTLILIELKIISKYCNLD